MKMMRFTLNRGYQRLKISMLGLPRTLSLSPQKKFQAQSSMTRHPVNGQTNEANKYPKFILI